MIATELNIPIVPAYVDGTHSSLPKSGSFPKPKLITVRFGQTIHPSQLAKNNSSNRHTYSDVTNELAKRINALENEHNGN